MPRVKKSLGDPTIDPIAQQIALNITYVRMLLGLRYTDLAVRTDGALSPLSVSRICQGKRTVLAAELVVLGEALDIEPGNLTRAWPTYQDESPWTWSPAAVAPVQRGHLPTESRILRQLRRQAIGDWQTAAGMLRPDLVSDIFSINNMAVREPKVPERGDIEGTAQLQMAVASVLADLLGQTLNRWTRWRSEAEALWSSLAQSDRRPTEIATRLEGSLELQAQFERDHARSVAYYNERRQVSADLQGLPEYCRPPHAGKIWEREVLTALQGFNAEVADPNPWTSFERVRQAVVGSSLNHLVSWAERNPRLEPRGFGELWTLERRKVHIAEDED